MDLQYHNFLRESFRCRKQIDISVPVKFTDFGIQTRGPQSVKYEARKKVKWLEAGGTDTKRPFRRQYVTVHGHLSSLSIQIFVVKIN